MPTDTRAQLRKLGDELYRSSTPISLGEVAGSADLASSGPDGTMQPAHPRFTRTTGARVATLVVVAAAIVGLVVIANRPTSRSATGSPDAAVLLEPMAPDGALVLDRELSNWQLQSASDDLIGAGFGVFIRRIYTTEASRPEEGPSLIVESFDTDAGSPDLNASTASITVGGVEGFLFNRPPGGRGLAFESDGFWYDITAYNLTTEELVAAAEAARRADNGYGAIVDSSGLPDGLVDEIAGEQGESWFLSRAALDNPIPTGRWENGASSIWLQTLQQDGSADRFQRIGAATIVDAAVNGQPAFLRTLTGQGQYRSLTWHADGRTHMLGSVDVNADELIEFAETLRPATMSEWNAVAPSEACMGVKCAGLPEPGSIVLSGVDLFPLIDDALVPNDGRGATYAQYLYFPEYSGPIWTGVIGAPNTNVYENLITVMVSAGADAEPLSTVPGRTPDVGEYDYDSGIGLVRTTSDDAVVTVQGREIDQLYAVLEHIEPTITDGELSGYDLSGDLPIGLSEIERPDKRAFEDGSFPVLTVHGGVLDIRIITGPALTHVSGWIGPIERLSVNERPALFHARTQGDYAILAIELGDGNTLAIAGDGFSRQELIDLANNIGFVDEQAWNSRYGAVPAVIPRTVDDTPSTTVGVEQGE